MPPGGFIINVVAAKAAVEFIEEKIALVGTLVANESVEIKSEIDGVVEDINCDEGRPVKAGDILFRIDENKLRHTLEEARSALNLAETTAKRYETLIKSRAVSQQEYDEINAGLASNRAKVQLMEEALKDATITAPFDGITGQRLVSAGQFVSKGASLSFLVSQNPVKAEFTVPERYSSRIKEEQKVEIQVTAYPDETFSGQVYFIDPQVNGVARTVLMKAKIPNRDGHLKPGMFANLNLIVSVKNNALVIPETAVMVKGDTTSVFIISEDNKASLNPVELGIRLAGRVEVTQGLREGDVVVVEGFQKLREGADVKVRFEDENSKE